MEDIVEYLESKDLEVKPRGTENVSTHCFFCDEGTDKAGRLYINVDEEGDKYGVFFCHLCNAKGNINTIREHFGDPKISLEPIKYESNPIYEIAAQYYEDRLLEHPDAYKYLADKRGLHDATIRQARLGWADGGLCNYLIQKGFDPEDMKSTGLVNRYGEDFFHNQITFPYMEHGIARSIRGKGIGKKTISLPGELPIPYGLDTAIGEKTVSICEGEIDTLTMHQMGFPTIGIPGALSFKADWVDYLDEAKRIYTILDRDKAGKAGAEKIATTLGPRVRVVELPKKDLDVNDWYFKYGKNRDDFDYLMRQAKGGLLISVREAYDRWLEIEGNPDLTGLKFNVPKLDEAMSFGLLPGQIVTMLARTNSGKTVMSINYFERMRMLYPDIKILYLSLEQTRNEWFERAYRIHNFYHPGATVVDTMDFWGDNFYLVDKNRVNEGQLIDSIEQFSYETDGVPDLICIDYLGYYAKGFGGSEYDQVTNAIMGIKGIAKEFQTVIYVPHQANRAGEFGKEPRMDEGRGGGTVEETSDLFITLWNPDQANAQESGEQQVNKGELYQRLKKSRQGGVGALAKYQFAPLTLAMVPTDDVLYERALAERQYALGGDDWKKAAQRHLTGNMEV